MFSFETQTVNMWKQVEEIISKINAWRKHNPLGFWVSMVGLLILGLALAETVRRNNLGFSDKTLWDWLDLFIVSAVVALGLFWLRQREDKRDEERQKQETARHERQQKQEKARQVDRQHEATLQAYFDRMSELMLDANLGELTAQQLGEEDRQDATLSGRDSRSIAAVIARARTLAVLRLLDPDRVSAVFRFLDEAQLVDTVSLAGGDLNKVDWHMADLRPANLSAVNLRGANLSGADLRRIDLSEANLRRANLSRADLFDTDLSGANLYRADLSGADLSEANLHKVNLREVDLSGAYLSDVNLHRAYLYEANLSGVDLSRSDLSGADLYRANLGGADLIGADLRGTDLSNAICNANTVWPDGFNLEEAGVVVAEERNLDADTE